MRTYYIHYDELAKINYCVIFCLYMIAQKNGKEKINDIIIYKNQKELVEQIKKECDYNIAESTVSKILNDTKKGYNTYFIKQENENIIRLNCNFKKGKAVSNKFITITEEEIRFLLKQDDKLLNKYYLYFKYYCGYSKSGRIDTTTNQILSAIGYSPNCGNNKQKLSDYNNLLVKQGYIEITRYTDTAGHCRNFYKITA